MAAVMTDIMGVVAIGEGDGGNGGVSARGWEFISFAALALAGDSPRCLLRGLSLFLSVTFRHRSIVLTR
jgi:hypothetical protein